MIIRSWLFVPGDSERKLEKGRENSADALILDLEDSVANDRQAIAREMVCAFLKANPDRSRQRLWVRINPLDTELALPDLAAVMPGAPDGIVPAQGVLGCGGEHAGELPLRARGARGQARGARRFCASRPKPRPRSSPSIPI